MGLKKSRLVLLRGSRLIAGCKMYKRNTFGIIGPLTRNSFVVMKKDKCAIKRSSDLKMKSDGKGKAKRAEQNYHAQDE